MDDFQPLERLRARHLMDEVAVDVDQDRAVGVPADEGQIRAFRRGCGTCSSDPPNGKL
jgi:hypothetical protein